MLLLLFARCFAYQAPPASPADHLSDPFATGWMGENHNAPLYMVMTGGVFMLLAALLVARVEDVSADVPGRAVIRGDEAEPLLTQESVQPVPSTALFDHEGKGR